MERIGDLLSKGVSLMLSNESKVVMEENVSKRITDASGLDVACRTILTFIHEVGSASPRDIERRLNMQRRTVSRKLSNLQEAGLLTKRGQTSATRYEIRQGLVFQDGPSGASHAHERMRGKHEYENATLGT